jgi:glyoxylase-like metal-dependent hydrolase (beta-lactamase superfamily II)
VKLGDLEFWILNDGGFRLDGGSMFGIVPKPLWEKKIPADDRNRIQLEMNCLLVHAAGKLLLVETGAGDKWDAKRREIYALGNGVRLPEQLARRGVGLDQIDYVVNTHLHFDHCGWNTRIVNGQAAPTFPNAQYVVQRGELEHAKHANEKDRASYATDNFIPIEAAGQWRLLDGDQQVLPGVEVIRVPGHNADMQCVRLSGGGHAAFFFADLVPTTAHLSYPWILAYDLYPLTTLENKHKWIPEIARSKTIALFPHDSKVPAARLYERDGQFHAEPIEVD